MTVRKPAPAWRSVWRSVWRRALVLAGALMLAPPAQAESGGRLLYFLNCLGCHPQPAQDPGALGGPLRPVGAFYQTEAGRRFFIRLPPAGAAPKAEDERLLREEIDNWKAACFAMTASTPLIRNRHVGRGG